MNSSKIIEEFTDYQRARNLAPGTIEKTRTWLRIFFTYLEKEGIEILKDIDTQFMFKYQIHLSIVKNRHGKAYNPSTQNYAISSIRNLFKYLRRCGHAQNDPTADLELAKAPRPLPRNILSIAEMEALLLIPDTSKSLGLRDRAILEVLYSSGMRNSECRKLDLEDLDLNACTAFIRSGKGGRDRVVPITRPTRKILAEYILTERKQSLNNPDEEAVFINKFGERLGKQGLYTMVKRRARQAGIDKNISPHSIRHTIATHLTDVDCNLRYIQELLGHSRADTTAIYISVSAKSLKDAIRKYHPRSKLKSRKQVVSGEIRGQKKHKKMRFFLA